MVCKSLLKKQPKDAFYIMLLVNLCYLKTAEIHIFSNLSVANYWTEHE